MSSKKNIIVVGGGGAGAQVARALSQKLDSTRYSLILISNREFYIHYPAALRMVASSKDHLEEKVLIPYDKLFLNNNGSFVRAAVTSIVRNESGRGGKVVTDSGKDYEYEALVLATGSLWEGVLNIPQLKEEAVTFINDWRGKIEDSAGVVLVGGGAVGTELAGEIRDIYPEKKITIVHRDNHLLSSVYPDKFRVDVDKRWTKRQILVTFNDQIDDIPAYPAAQVMTKQGTRLEADLVIPTRGGRPNTGFISSLGEGVLTPEGYVKVDATLQVVDIPGVFAAGDILNWKEVKQVAKYGGHAGTIVPNLLSFLDAKPLAVKYKSMLEAIFLTNGARGGAAFVDALWGLRFGDRVARTVKSAELFIKMTRGNMGY